MIGVGVDIVDIARITTARQRSSGRFATRLCGQREQEWVGDDDVRLAAAFALKEAWIKANGGRPPGFSWSACALDLGASHAPVWLRADAALTPQPVGGLAGAWMERDGEMLAFVGDAVRAEVAEVDVAFADERQLSERERSYCAGQRPRVAGRVAAKEAVRRLVGIADAEILPGSHPADSPVPCRGESHPPVVSVAGEVGHVRVSISHSPHRAIAVAFN